MSGLALLEIMFDAGAMFDPPRPRLRRLPGNVHGRRNRSRPDRLVQVLMSDGAWYPATVLEQWQLANGQWCVMLRFPLPEQVTTSTQPFLHDPAVLRPLPNGRDLRTWPWDSPRPGPQGLSARNA